MSWQVVHTLWVVFKWKSYIIFESCDRAVLKTTINTGMIEICFYCLFTHIRNQPKYNRCAGKCTSCATYMYVHCTNGRVLSNHANREVYASEISLNFVDFSMCQTDMGLHWLLWRHKRQQEQYFLHSHIGTLLYQWQSRSNHHQFLRLNYAGIYVKFCGC